MEYRVADGIMSDEVGGGLPQAYRALGELLDREDRCNELADYVASIYVTLAQIKEAVPEEERKTFYYGEGNLCLSTRGSDTLLGKIAESIGANNILEAIDNTNLCFINPLDLYNCNPDVYILNISESNVKEIATELNEGIWGELIADNNATAYAIPSHPGCWLDRSPLLIQTFGALWFAGACYQERFGSVPLEVISSFRTIFLRG